MQIIDGTAIYTVIKGVGNIATYESLDALIQDQLAEWTVGKTQEEWGIFKRGIELSIGEITQDYHLDPGYEDNKDA